MPLTEDQILSYVRIQSNYKKAIDELEYAKSYRLGPAAVKKCERRLEDAKLDLTIIKQELKIM